MRLVDTDIVADLLIESERTPRARVLLDADPDWHSESYVMVELTNVVATQMRSRRLTWRDATTALDARFLVVAGTLGVPLVTADAKLRKAAPAWTLSLDDALSP